MERIAILVASSPTSTSAQEAFALVRSLAALGHRVSLVLLEDAAVAATSPNLGVPLDLCASVLVNGSDLTLRGFGPDSLLTPARVSTYGEIVDLMMEQTDRTLGVFSGP
ncbi:MAG: DsrE family protein [Bacillota bacterium]